MIHQSKKPSKVWFITGASRGFGRVWAEAALSRGDKVATTARKLESIAGLKEKLLQIKRPAFRPEDNSIVIAEEKLIQKRQKGSNALPNGY